MRRFSFCCAAPRHHNTNGIPSPRAASRALHLARAAFKWGRAKHGPRSSWIGTESGGVGVS
eukprot:4866588-Pleurochrysis_carterae.AAC.1